MYYTIKDTVEKIEGWMDSPDMEWLYNTSSQVNEDGIIVEVGSWKGRSTSAIAMGAKTKNFYCVDTWKGNIGPYEEGYTGIGIEAYNSFIENLKKTAGYVPFILASESSKTAILFADNSIDFIFIDANHLADDVEKDVRSWLPKLKNNGIMSGHDWAKAGGEIPKALKRIIDIRKIKLTECSIWWFKKSDLEL